MPPRTASRRCATAGSASVIAAYQRRSVCQQHRAGEKLLIDYCGPTVPFIDTAIGEVVEAQVFVAVWGASSYAYAEATRTQSLPDWIGAQPTGAELL